MNRVSAGLTETMHPRLHNVCARSRVICLNLCASFLAERLSNAFGCEDFADETLQLLQLSRVVCMWAWSVTVYVKSPSFHMPMKVSVEGHFI